MRGACSLRRLCFHAVHVNVVRRSNDGNFSEQTFHSLPKCFCDYGDVVLFSKQFYTLCFARYVPVVALTSLLQVTDNLFSRFEQEGWVELRKEYAGLLNKGSMYIFRKGVFLPPNTSYGAQVSRPGLTCRIYIFFRCD